MEYELGRVVQVALAVEVVQAIVNPAWVDLASVRIIGRLSAFVGKLGWKASIRGWDIWL